MGNANVKEFFSKDNNLIKLSRSVHYYCAEDLNNDSFLVNHWGKMNIKNADAEKYMDWDNVRTFAQDAGDSIENIDEYITLNGVKQKLLIGMIPQEKCPDLANPQFFDSI